MHVPVADSCNDLGTVVGYHRAMPENEGIRTELVYLVRLWSERPGTWRASLEDVATHERVYLLGPHEVGDVLSLRCGVDGALD